MVRMLASLCESPDANTDNAWASLPQWMGDVNARRVSAPVAHAPITPSSPGLTPMPDGAWLLRIPQDQALTDADHRLFSEIQQALDRLAALPAATPIVLDVRPQTLPRRLDERTLPQVLAQLIQGPLSLPRTKRPYRSGFDAVHGMDGSHAGMRWAAMPPLAGTATGPGHPLRVLADERTVIQAPIWALLQQGRATLYTPGAGRSPMVGDMKTVLLSDGSAFHFTVGSFSRSGAGDGETPAPDALPVSGRFEACEPAATDCGEAAVTLHPEPTRWLPPFAATADAVKEPAFAATPELPSVSERLQAVIRLWSSLMATSRPVSFPTERWHDARDQALAAMLTVSSKGDYVDVLRRMLSAVEDGHARLFGAWVRDRIGRGELPLRWQRIGDDWWITEGTGPLRPGDQVLSINGRPMAQAVAAQLPLVSAATPASREWLAADLLRHGPIDAPVELRIKRQQRASTVTLAFSATPLPEPAPLPSRRLSATVGYLNLAATPEPAVMDDELGSVRALIVDLRHYPLPGAWALAQRLQRTSRVAGPVSVMPRQGADTDPGWRPVPLIAAAVHWPARVIALIGPETMSRGEYSVLLLKAVSEVCTVGDTSFGVYGDITNDALPGRLWLSFTADDVMTAAGPIAPSTGIEPDIRIRPTVRDLQTGHDPVLARARRVAEQGLPCPGQTHTHMHMHMPTR